MVGPRLAPLTTNKRTATRGSGRGTTVTPTLSDACWPMNRLSEALEALAVGSDRAAGVVPDPAVLVFPHSGKIHWRHLGRWLESIAKRLGLETEPVETAYSEVERFLRTAGPALLFLPDD